MKIAIVILCLVLVGCGQPTGRYQMVTNHSITAESAWKIDSITGAVWFCDEVGSNGQPVYECVRAVQR